jgi:pimeloyl-ACP methyl ester carboxylesterase
VTAALATDVVQGPWGFPTVVHRGGAASGRPLVFLHSAAAVNPHDPLLLALAERFEVIAPVHPGFSDLGELDGIRDVHDVAFYYDDLLDALGLDDAQVVGHSLGGMFAAELAAHVPRRVSRLVLAAPLGLWNDEYPVADLFVAFPGDISELVWADPGGEAAQAFMAAATQAPGVGADEPVHEDPLIATLIGLLQGLTTAGKFLWPLPDKGLSRRLRRVRAQTLVVWGADDRLAPARYAEDFARLLPSARVEVLDGAGHMAPYERQAQFVDLVTAFLRD